MRKEGLNGIRPRLDKAVSIVLDFRSRCDDELRAGLSLDGGGSTGKRDRASGARSL